ncbi:hypothetical protein B0H19DRAFT_1124418 [Mycena capillaripes]|nr:hypothetical protein B0H19DRAFT_1124418 [Mycena capillaripes]
MPLFSSSSGFQINGGSFIDIARDVNIQSAAPTDFLAELSLLGAYGRQLPGPDRSVRQTETARMLPYDISRRPQISLGPGETVPDKQLWDFDAAHPSLTPDGAQLERRYAVSRRDSFATSQHPSLGGDASPATGSEAPRHDHHIVSGSRLQKEPQTNITVGGNVNHIQRYGETGLHILHNASARDAFHDSAERSPQPKCHPETRKKMLEDLWNWASSDDPRSGVLWLYGPAGAGKSAIAQSLCQKLEQAGRFGGGFFFKRGDPSRGNAKRLFPTLAYQLALLKGSHLHRAISRRVEENPSILDRSLSGQLQELIIEPCRKSPDARHLVLVIDGLDECDRQHVQQEVLDAIGNCIAGGRLPLRFLIASRPEPHIGEIFRSPCLKTVHRPLNVLQSFDDVRRYLVDEFARVHTQHDETMATVPAPWPPQRVIEHLVQKSSGYFIYASTVVKFIDDKNFRPTERLEIIMGLAEPELGSPFASLDQLYIQILSSAPQRPQLLRILTVMMSEFNLDVDHIEQLLRRKAGDARLTLRDLHSLLMVDARITVHHASFRDFLHDPTRSGPFYVGSSQHRDNLVRDILKAFSHECDSPAFDMIRKLKFQTAFQYITSVKPSPDLVALLPLFQPDYLFPLGRPNVTKALDMTLTWLKVCSASGIHKVMLTRIQQIRPPPQRLIQLWQDYRFMGLCDNIWSEPRISIDSQTNRLAIPLLEASPELVRILHTYAFTCAANDSCLRPSLSDIRGLLDLTWEELRTSICALTAKTGQNEGILRNLLLSATQPSVFRAFDARLTSGTLVRNFMTTIRKTHLGELPCRTWGCIRSFSYLLRSQPPFLELLIELHGLYLGCPGLFDEWNAQTFYHIIKWLWTLTEPPIELISDFQHRLDSREHLLGRYESNYEDSWRKWKEHPLRWGYFSA